MSLYNKYRPQTFSQIINQTNVVGNIVESIKNNNVGHAYLFLGPRGTGKTSTARILAKRLNCENPAGVEPCNGCDPCVDITKGHSLSVTEYDAASNSGVDAMRDILESTKFTPLGKYRVIIIDEAHMLSTAAANAALKTLEEPPARVVFILATTDEKRVLKTVKSRCKQLKFSLVTQEHLEPFIRWVAGEEKIDPDLVGRALSLGAGSVRDTLSALEASVGTTGELDTAGRVMCEALASKDVRTIFVKVAELSAAGEDMRGVAEDTAGLLREVFLGLMGAEDLVREVDWGQRARVGESLGARGVVSCIEAIGAALTSMSAGGDARVNFEVHLARWAAVQS